MTDEEREAVRTAAIALGLTKTWIVKLTGLSQCWLEAVDEESAIAAAKKMYSRYEMSDHITATEFKHAKR